MSTQTDKLPPVPQLVPPLRNYELNRVGGDSKPESLRFDVTWLQWFVQLKIKVDTINDSVIAASAVSGSGFLSATSPTSWVPRTIEGTPGRVIVTNGDGVLGNPTIDYIGSSGSGQINRITTTGDFRRTTQNDLRIT